MKALAAISVSALFVFALTINAYSTEQAEVKLTVSTIYDEPIAEQLAGFSMASYCRKSSIEHWNCGQSCKKNQPITDVTVMKNVTMNASGFTAYSPDLDAIIVVFRGTVPWLITNWISDIDTVKVDYPLCSPSCKVHKGFYRAFKELQGQVTELFSALKSKYPKAKVYVAGHSLGAAMATHSVPIIHKLNKGEPIDAFYIFGSPRVGDLNYHEWFEKQNFALKFARISHNADPVPHLPPHDFPFKFTHIDHEVFYKTFKKPYVVCDLAESKKCADGVLLPASVPDHLTYYGWDWAGNILACQ